MSGRDRPVRRAQVRALAKINLDLRVLARRPDGYHELRTIFQTISLADTLDISFTPARRTSIVIDDALRIPGNLAERAASLVMETLRASGKVEIRLVKRIPLGAGLGGGSSDAAAVLLALPVLAGRRPDLAVLCEMGEQLGSDVPFFLLGGTAVGIGRGSELFPLPDRPSPPGLLVTPGVHVSTAHAYERLSGRLDAQAAKYFASSRKPGGWTPPRTEKTILKPWSSSNTAARGVEEAADTSRRVRRHDDRQRLRALWAVSRSPGGDARLRSLPGRKEISHLAGHPPKLPLHVVARARAAHRRQSVAAPKPLRNLSADSNSTGTTAATISPGRSV